MYKMFNAFIFLVVLLILSFHVYADTSASNVHGVVTKMTKDLKLDDAQIIAVGPIVQKSIVKRKAYLDSNSDAMFSNKKEIKAAMLKFRDEEEAELSKVLTPAQMSKLIAKRQLRDTMNKDNVDFSEGLDGGTMTMQGPKMQF